MPSIRSSVAIDSSYRRRSVSRPGAERSVSSAASTACLASRTAIGGRSATRRASSSARSSHSRLPRTSFTTPSRAASSASKRRPVSTSSIARCLPTTRASRCVPPPPGMIPRVISGWPKTAVSEATIMSHTQRQLAPAAERPAETAAIDRRAAGGEPPPEAGRGVDERLLEAALAQRADVGAGREHLVAAGDHDAADLGVGVEPLDRPGELVHQLGRQRVARLGPVQPAQRDVPVDRLSRRAALDAAVTAALTQRRHRVDRRSRRGR